MTERERACLAFLNGRMDATAHNIGRYIVTRFGVQNGGSNYTAIGAGIAGTLNRRGLVMLADLGAWRITKIGRAELLATS